MSEIQAPPRAGAAASGVLSYGGDDPEDNRAPIDLQACRGLWWRLSRQGVRLPAEAGVILLDGGAR
jgi:hypothetical protein